MDLNIFLPFITPLLPLLVQDVLVFVVALAIVYSSGRMLGLVNSYKIKNALAIIGILGMQYMFHLQTISFDSIWNMIVNSSISIILYVLIGFKLYDRWDDFMDKRFGKDKKLRSKK